MKKLLCLIPVLWVLAITSCSDDDDNTNFEVPELTDDNSVQYTIAHDMSQLVGKYTFVNIAGDKIAVDWGDGTLEKYSSKEMIMVKHVYTSQSGEYTIKIWTENLTDLYIDGANNVGSSVLSGHLDIGNAPKLTNLVIRKCQNLVSFDISKCPNLEILNCEQNSLESLDVSQNLELKRLICNNNKLSTLDISNNLELVDLTCLFNELEALDISKNLKLKYLLGHGNKLTTLDVTKNKELYFLFCGANQFDTSALNQIFEDLPAASWVKESGHRVYLIQFVENPGYEACDESIITSKGWTVINQTFSKE